jgi:hypothetical protein
MRQGVLAHPDGDPRTGKRTRSMTRMSLLAAPLLVVGLLAGCGDDAAGAADAADAPTHATVEEFCQPFVDMFQDISAQGEDISDEDAVRLAKETAEKLADAGTPDDMPQDARKGFELVVKKLSELPDDATKEEVEEAQTLTEEEQQYSDALSRYVAEKCADQLFPDGGGG